VTKGDRLALLEQAIALIADTVIVRVVCTKDQHTVEYGCGICQGPWDPDLDKCKHERWCPRGARPMEDA